MRAGRHRVRAGLTGLAVCLLLVTGCGGSDTATPDQTPRQALAAAQRTLDATSGVKIELSTDDLPAGVTGITTAQGTGVHPSAFEGTFSLSYRGLPTQAQVIAVDGTTYAKNAILLPDWTPIDPADYGAPDPGALMDPGGGFSGLLAATTDLTRGKTVRGGQDHKEILTGYSGTVPAAAVAAIIPSASGDFTVTYTLTDDDQLREAVVTGAFYADAAPVTYHLVLDDYGTKQSIAAPTS